MNLELVLILFTDIIQRICASILEVKYYYQNKYFKRISFAFKSEYLYDY